MAVTHVKGFPREWIGEVVINDAVVSRVEASGDGVVVGESERGKNGNQTGFGFGSVSDQTGNVGCWGFELVTESEAVGGD